MHLPSPAQRLVQATKGLVGFWRTGYGLGLFALYAVLVARMRPIVWKLADETFCLADWEGFREAALPGLWPGGALRWLSSLLMTTGLVDGCWWLPYLLLPPALAAAVALLGRASPRAFPLRLSAAPFLVVLASLELVGTHVWQLPDYAFPLTNLLGMCAMAALFAALRRRVWAAGVACAVGFVPLGLYAPLAGAFVLLDEVTRDGFRRWRALAVSAALLAATPALAASLVYGDVSSFLATGFSQSILNGALLEPLGFFSVAAFALLALDLVGAGRFAGKTAWGRRLARVPWGAALCAAVFAWLPREDLRVQLGMERCIVEGRDAEALRIEAADPCPLRMSLAYRVLALWRTGRLEGELFARPFTSFHRTSQAEELKMDGYRLFFAYGFLLPARQQAMEHVSRRGWQPGHLQVMGDAAFLAGEHALAARDWGQLARCPFRGAFARRRLEALLAGRGLGDSAFADLRSVALLHATWCERVDVRPEPPFFFLKDSNVEDFVYRRLLTVKGTPPPEVARLILAAYLLEKDVTAFGRSADVMGAICPEGPWPRLWQQGMLAYLGQLPADARDRVVSGLRDGLFTQEEAARFDAFVEDLRGIATNGVDLVSRYGDTFYFYEACVK